MEEYDKWNEVKKHTQRKERKLGMKPREIFWVKIGQNLGSEEYGIMIIFIHLLIPINQEVR